ncbi:MAG: ABC transporter ATP-binding protein [Clostridia bacterium]|nr:ABC transporter ATP-binding protein [Clostridia bacterium]
MEVKNLDFSYGKEKVLDDVSLKVKRGKITTIIGANGCGKSTLFNVMTKNLKPQKGNVYLDGTDISKISLKSFARRAAIVHQYNTAPYDTTVETLVGYGRLAYSQFGISDKEEDEKYISYALEATELTELRDCNIAELSGGQRQRVWIAMALAQNTDILFLDEPTTYLDIKYQIEILRLIKRLNEKHNMTIVMVLHDINQAAFYSDEMIAMKDGKIIANGSPDSVLTEDVIKETYGIHLDIEKVGGRNFIVAV